MNFSGLKCKEEMVKVYNVKNITAHKSKFIALANQVYYSVKSFVFYEKKDNSNNFFFKDTKLFGIILNDSLNSSI